MSKLSLDWDKTWQNWKQSIEREIETVSNSEHYPLVVRELSRYKKGSRVMDAGSGLGRWVFYLEKRGYKAYGIDLSKSAVKRTKKYAQDNNLLSKFIYGDLRTLPIRSNFLDFVLSFGAIEHFRDSIEAVKEFYRVSRPNGGCYITTPNIFSFHSLIGRPVLNILKSRRLGYLGYEDSYTPASLARMMKQAGFVNISYGVIPTGELFGTFYQIIPLIGKLLYRFLRKVSYFIESRQSTVGFISYAIGYRIG